MVSIGCKETTASAAPMASGALDRLPSRRSYARRLRDGLKVVKEGKPALVDVVCQIEALKTKEGEREELNRGLTLKPSLCF